MSEFTDYFMNFLLITFIFLIVILPFIKKYRNSKNTNKTQTQSTLNFRNPQNNSQQKCFSLHPTDSIHNYNDQLKKYINQKTTFTVQTVF